MGVDGTTNLPVSPSSYQMAGALPSSIGGKSYQAADSGTGTMMNTSPSVRLQGMWMGRQEHAQNRVMYGQQHMQPMAGQTGYGASQMVMSSQPTDAMSTAAAYGGLSS